ncbi:hypothetical protein [Acidiplasma aeolicum]|jgi:hypothetical protein|uniref:hypothetical protein n=1 Tax=Acidiplasma aeolicum TaxID=507754 RepID=UPI0037158EA0
METNKTIGIAIDDNWGCIDSVVVDFITGFVIELSIIAILLALSLIGFALFILSLIFVDLVHYIVYL